MPTRHHLPVYTKKNQKGMILPTFSVLEIYRSCIVNEILDFLPRSR